MFQKTLLRTFWTVYDHLGLLVLVNLCWIATTLPWWVLIVWSSRAFRPPFSAIMLVAIVPVAFLNPGAGGVAAVAHRLVRDDEASLPTFWEGFRSHFARFVWLMGVGVLLTLALVSSWVFYSTGRLPAVGRWGNLFAAGLTFWAALFVALIAFYWPVLAVEWRGKGLGIGTILHRSVLLTLDNLGFTLGAVLSFVVVELFWLVTGLGAVVLVASVGSVLQQHARNVLREKYEVIAALRQEGKIPTRETVRAALHARWQQEPKRSWKELLRPWDSGR